MRKLFLLIFSVMILLLVNGCSRSVKIIIPSIENSILANRTIWSTTENVYEVPVEAIEKVQGSEIYRFQDSLLSAYYVYDSEVKKSFYYVDKISLENGEVLYSIQIEDMMTPDIQVLEEYVVVKDIQKKTAMVYDTELQLVAQHQFQEDSYVFSLDNSKVYVFTDNFGIQVVDLKNNTVSSILENARDISVLEVSGNTVTFTYVNVESLRRVGAMLELSSGSVQEYSDEKSVRSLEYMNGMWLGGLYTDEYVYGSDPCKRLVFEDAKSFSLLSDAGHILCKGYNEEWQSILTVFDSEGEYVSSVELVGTANTLMYEPVWFEEYNGYFMTLMSEEDGKDRLLFWDMSVESDGKDLLFTSVEESRVSDSSVSKQYFDKTMELSDKYGVDILIAEQCDTLFPDHSADLLLSQADIEVALDTLEVTLAMYPDGFFEQLKYDTFDTIEIQVLGTLRKNTSTEDVTYISGAFVYAELDKLVMVLDGRGTYEKINQNLQQTFFHESSHLIERRLKFRGRYYEDQVFSEEKWNALNPVDFEYNNSYYGVLDPRYSDYFIDQYACSNADEDRARIFEYAVMGRVDVFDGKQGLIDKLVYYCECIRDGFDCSEWDSVIWEEVIKVIEK